MDNKTTLVIVLGETRAHELTFESFKKNVIDELKADLCICIGVKPDYDTDNPFYRLAKYKFTYNEPEGGDYGDAFEYAYNHIVSQRTQKYEKLENINAMHGKIGSPQQQTDNLVYRGDIKDFSFDSCNDETIVVHTSSFPKEDWKNRVYSLVRSDDPCNFVSEKDVITYRKPLYWREILKLSLAGWGVKGAKNVAPASSGILVFYRWFLLQNLINNELINQYTRFVITRSDFIYQLPHPKMDLLDENSVWIPDSEHYGGYTDRHAVLSKTNIADYLNIFGAFVTRSNEYYLNLAKSSHFNLEQLIKFHLDQHGLLSAVKEFPYVMYSVRGPSGTTRWAWGTFSKELGYFIKYTSEYDRSKSYKNEFEKSALDIDTFYKINLKLL